jgi:hypothetical protein
MIRVSVVFLLTGGLIALGSAASAQPQETRRQYLSGHGKDDAVPWKFLCTSGAQSGYWTNLPVPSNWELHGFGSLNYRKDPTNAWDERGLYQCEFAAPSDWAGQRTFLVFEGVMTDTGARLNGEPVGPLHQGGFYRFKYEVTGLLRPGFTNRLEVAVAKHSANNSVNHAERTADYWVFGGIFRPVYLEATPPRFIERVAIDARADGAFIMEVFANGITNGASLEAQILSADSRPVGPPFTEHLAGAKTTLRTRMASPRTWTAETPNLYVAEVRLKEGDKALHVYRQRFGFRTMEVLAGDGLYVNGRRVVLQGADRHSFWPDSGRCLSEAVHRLDINLMKDMNMNAVRMSHYPPDAEFLDLCDELGLYVLDELAGWHAFYDTETGTKLVHEMVPRDVNHPCILFWDNGNEGGFNTNLDHLFLELDPQQRRVLHPWTPFSGVNTSHYLTYENARLACAGVPTYYRQGREVADTNAATKFIYMPTEFQHGLYDGGAGAGLEDYWTLMRSSKVLGGGFIWALTDDGVKRPDTGQIDVAGNQAPDGIVGPYRQKEGSFYTVKELWSPLVVLDQALPPDFSGTLRLENRYSFTDANQCKFAWELRKFALPGETGPGFAVLARGTADAPAIPPGEKGSLRLRLPEDWARADALALRISDPAGRELWTQVWPLGVLDAFRKLPTASSSLKTRESETADAVQASVGDLTVTISKQTGLLQSVKRGAQIFSLANGPRPAAGRATLASLEKMVKDDGLSVTATFEGDLKRVVWHIRDNGWVHCDYAYVAEGPKDFHGVAFDYPENLVRRKRWLGDGPYRVWKNRLRGVSLGVWENDYNNTITGWADWVYPEFKGCFGNVRWLQLETVEGPITAVMGRDDLFVQVLRPDFPPSKLSGKTVPALPQAGLAILHAIPPVGSKFHEPSKGGPRSQVNIGAGSYTGSVDFYFGPLP